MNSFRKEFSLKYLSLYHKRTTDFVTSQWQKGSQPSIVYLVYRWTVALFFFSSLLGCLISDSGKSYSFQVKFFIYCTNWMYMLCTVQTVFGAVLSSIYTWKRREASNSEVLSVKYCSIYWGCNLVSTDVAFVVTITYWLVLFKANGLDVCNYLKHGNNSILILVDLFVVKHPVRILHFCYGAVFVIVYGFFTYIYYVLGGVNQEGEPYIYPFTDWRTPGVTLGKGIGIICFVLGIHVVIWALYKLRRWIHSKCFDLTDYGHIDDDNQIEIL